MMLGKCGFLHHITIAIRTVLQDKLGHEEIMLGKNQFPLNDLQTLSTLLLISSDVRVDFGLRKYLCFYKLFDKVIEHYK
jgi:hypothetical protein